ncbi:hypothetical protein Cgig2_011583 [Carnegiea gigantea]|uniref:dihydrolipoyllysine-residue (2-methylpropanoyl)transferase n=1 Tax=Carnegiea gigantea TaxID=171969 RepID=A0A9Q1K6H2_9CARY|nr:hypothetical protein Cgig2_011583 [Carnegiea gigantea]
MVVIRRIWLRPPLCSVCRRLSRYTPATAPAPAVSEPKHPLLGFFSLIASSRLGLHKFFNARYYMSHAAVDHLVGGIVDVPLAQTGEGIAECELLKWFVQELGEGYPISDHSLEAIDLLDCRVGETLLKIGVDGFSAETISNSLSDPEINGPANLGDSSTQASSVSQVLCTPAVRSLAKQLGIDINDVRGSGKDGRILKEDVLNYVGGKDVDVEPSAYSDCSPQSVAERLQYKDEILQLRKRKQTNGDLMFIFVLSFVGSHNIGIAMATPTGLVVPNIKNVQSLSVLEITKEISRLQQLAMDNKLSHGDISGGTITVSNIGAIGGKFGSPLINLPEVAIVAIGRIQKVPHITDEGTVYPLPVMNVNIGADHRILDGATVARFCNEWKSFVENPELLLLRMR